MSLKELREKLGEREYAKDIKLNLGRVLEEDGAPGLSLKQIQYVAMASAYALKNEYVIKNIQEEVEEEFEKGTLSKKDLSVSKGVATIMAMNNVYYRFTHLVSNKEYQSMPAQLRMNIIANSGIEKVDFEIMSLAVSAINGCGLCIDSHVRELVKAGLSKSGVQSVIRIAATLSGTAQALAI